MREFGKNSVFHLSGLSNGKLENIFFPSEGESTDIAATHDVAAMKVYYNSKLIDEVAASGTISTSISPLYIGTKYPGGPVSNEYEGIIE